MRKPADPEHRGRGVVGWTALIIATAGLLHLGQQPADDAEMDHAGGLIGCGVGGLLERAVTAWVAVPLLVLLLLFGLLVITATPISKVPERLGAAGATSLLGRPRRRRADADEAEDERGRGRGGAASARRPAARRRQGALADLGLDDDAGRRRRSSHDTVALPRTPPAKVPASRKPPRAAGALAAADPRRAARHSPIAGDYRLPPPNLLGTGDARRRPAAAPTTR